ncbi:MAG TPA: hypothetical protein VKX28_03150 [Xanthobacteraceae bacterium]|jgi:hypothetical protein|nr:hypothetical protein [Xanthobacteraceae bacterium]
MICQSCGVEAPTQKVLFVQHIGAIVMFFHKRIGGLFCRNCVNKYFTEYFFITLVAGWWGVISVFATPVVLLIDLVNYFRAWSLPPVPSGATAPVLTDDAISRINPLGAELIRRLNGNERLETVATDVAARARVTPGQVVRYVQALIAQQKAGKA